MNQNGSIHLMHPYSTKKADHCYCFAIYLGYKHDIIFSYSLFDLEEKTLLLIIMQHNDLKKRGQLSESNVCQHGVGTSSM